MKLEVVTPDDYTGDIIGDLNRRRGMIEGMESKMGAQIVKAKVPLSGMFGDATTLRTLSSGMCNFNYGVPFIFSSTRWYCKRDYRKIR